MKKVMYVGLKEFKMKKSILILSILSLTGCMNERIDTYNPRTHTHGFCEVHSFGVISTILAWNYMKKCKNKIANK